MLLTVANKFIAPNRELIPAKCKETINKSTLGPLWNRSQIKADSNYVDNFIYAS